MIKLIIVDPQEWRIYNQGGDVTAVKDWEISSPFRNYGFKVEVNEQDILWKHENVYYIKGKMSEEYNKELKKYEGMPNFFGSYAYR